MHGVPPLQWNADVAAYAQNWVKRLHGLKHSDAYKSAIGPMGENLYGASGMEVLGADAAKAWYSEETGYSYGNKNMGQAGHFTAMIWKDVKYLGCGRANGIIACNYWSGTKESSCSVPNMPGCFREQVPRPIRSAAACK
jgi:pathogenesis-related protein 1